MKSNQTEELEIDLGLIFRTLWRRLWILILAAVLAGGAAMAYTTMMVTPLYKSDVKFYVNNSSLSIGSTSVSITSGDISASQSLVQTYIVILNTRDTLNEIIAQTGVDYTVLELSSMISASPINNTEVFSVTVTTPNPHISTLLADTIAEVLPEKIASIIDETSARVVDTAVTPSAPDSPNLRNNTLLGVLVGLLISSAIIIIRVLTAQELKSEYDLLSIAELPILAVIPDTDSRTGYNYYSGNKKRKGYY